MLWFRDQERDLQIWSMENQNQLITAIPHRKPIIDPIFEIWTTAVHDDSPVVVSALNMKSTESQNYMLLKWHLDQQFWLIQKQNNNNKHPWGSWITITPGHWAAPSKTHLSTSLIEVSEDDFLQNNCQSKQNYIVHEETCKQKYSSL